MVSLFPLELILFLNDIWVGFYPSALHRVVIKNPNAPRYSIPFFFPPSSKSIIRPQPSLVQKDGEQKFEAITFEEYSRRMFESTNVYS